MPRMRLALMLVVSVACPAVAQAPVGPEFQANIVTTGWHVVPSVAMDSADNYVVAWFSVTELPQAMRARLFDSQGAPRGDEMTLTTGSHMSGPSLAGDPDGAFVVVWTRGVDYQQSFDVFGRRFSPSGLPLGREFRVNTYTTAVQDQAVVTRDATGRFVVAFRSYDSGQRVKLRRFNADGSPQGPEFPAQPGATIGIQQRPSLALDSAGNFIVVWLDWPRTVTGQRYAANGAPIGSSFQVNNTSSFFAYGPSVAAQPDGRFIVAWHDRDFQTDRVLARLHDANGVPVGPEFVVRHLGYSAFDGISTAADRSGGFVIAWSRMGADAFAGGIEAQRVDAAGQRIGQPTRINTTQAGHQESPAFAVNASGRMVAFWSSRMGGAGPSLIQGQRFGLWGAAALQVDIAASGSSDGNRVLEPGETVDMRPSWSNNTAGTQSVTGAITSFVGPPGAVYTITDAAGFYDAVPPGVSEACVDCYGVAVSAGPRPSPHWDASAREVINPGDDGHFDWVLHVGDSFTDVPRTNPFYRFVETLLHHGVTAGCGGSDYCPAIATTRDQMSVFVLTAREGPGFSPPACIVPVFNDVPASSAHCRWIEELVRRGVVGGCAPGLYCPTAAVTREQMAVFVLRTLDPALNPPPCTTPMFADVPASSPFCRWIEELARRGIVSGCGGGNYCPTAPVTREQMSVFLTGTFSLRLYGP